MFPNRPKMTVPIIVRKNGERSFAKFPVELNEGDQIIICQEMRGSKVPKGQKWTVNGYTTDGPIINKGLNK